MSSVKVQLSTRKRFALLSITALSVVGAAFITSHFLGCNKVSASTCGPVAEESHSAVELAPRYYQYSESSLTDAQKSGKVVLYFWAPWCSSCTSLDIEIQDKAASIPEGVSVLRVPYDKYPDLKQRYGVVTQHTFVQIDDDGNMLSTWVGGDIENFDNYLK